MKIIDFYDEDYLEKLENQEANQKYKNNIKRKAKKSEEIENDNNKVDNM